MKRLAFALAALIVCARPLSAAAPPRVAETWEPAKTYGVIVGVLQWEKGALSPFSTQKRKDQELSELLVKRGGAWLGGGGVREGGRGVQLRGGVDLQHDAARRAGRRAAARRRRRARYPWRGGARDRREHEVPGAAALRLLRVGLRPVVPLQFGE